MKTSRLSLVATFAFSTLVASSPTARANTCLVKCPADNVCIADPKPRCAVPDGACGGFAGLECTNPADVCVDDPRDDCDPLQGGADCIGVCVAAPKGGRR
ncbi:hypothetical protein N0V93_005709 [Gnomoniopsis smithogilvyi]|uniref:Uncharacterized protein n=1 Tax=Gnomoniopsis smithogilvyi TaxID=1191159 RepID=A0A9W9CXD8_9PEZI|nr:hypothetical protein N0V93_005709 [Gnomoniopsis smithogilvyi]